ncbi:hypothetical protein FQA39_LY03870 [Lamprigera yunnana]|nr:hypothetical protein FQA39_LY03870 [Lamprigera yunnana]
MILTKAFARCIHTKPSCWASQKSLLASLRKKTGYSFTNCKKALEMHNNDLEKAESWLHAEAQALGWSKATKLEGRPTSQGLVAVTVKNTNAALVEINCETDFVAKNKNFQKMAEMVATACLKYAESQPLRKGPLTKIGLDADRLKELPAPNGKSLADERALCLKVDDDVHLSSYAHPSGTEINDVAFGKFGGLIALKQVVPKDIDIDINSLGKSLCQHVVGMDPKKIGSTSDKPAENHDDETCLIYQEYIDDNEEIVNDILERNGIEVIDFKRFECGEDLCSGFKQPTIELAQ